MANLAKTKEARAPKKGARLHPVEVKDGKTYIGARHIRLGRRKDEKDARDRIARLEAAPPVAEEVLPYWRYWGDLTWRGDQGAFPHCVAYSASDWGVDGRASMRFSDVENLLFSEGGAAWRYVEMRPPA